MKRYLIYKKKTKQIEMISEGKIKYDKSIFSEKEINLTKKELEDIYNSERTILKNGKLTLKPRIDKKSKAKELETQLDSSSNIEEIKEIIKEFINL